MKPQVVWCHCAHPHPCVRFESKTYVKYRGNWSIDCADDITDPIPHENPDEVISDLMAAIVKGKVE